MSCYAKHPDMPLVECWHGEGHEGDHGKENKRWPNDADPLRIELSRLRELQTERDGRAADLHARDLELCDCVKAGGWEYSEENQLPRGVAHEFTIMQGESRGLARHPRQGAESIMTDVLKAALVDWRPTCGKCEAPVPAAPVRIARYLAMQMVFVTACHGKIETVAIVRGATELPQRVFCAAVQASEAPSGP